jgi:protein-tyrosine-phosphatase
VQHLKEAPEALDCKQLDDYDLIVVMEPIHKDAVLNKCPKCEDKILAWNIEDPYFRSPVQVERIYQQIKEKVTELANSLRKRHH